MDERSYNTTLQRGGLPGEGRSKLNRWVAASILLHLSVLGIVLYSRPPRLAPVELPGDLSGHLLLLTYSPGSGAPATELNTEKRLAKKRAPAPTVTARVPPPAAPSAAASTTTTETSTGDDALGDGDATIALVVSHPPPHPDLAQLPAGTRGDVIVDVVIDKTGRIAKSSLEHGLGHGVDETVLAVIQQWTFQPATRNGVPVASEQELLFHYERG